MKKSIIAIAIAAASLISTSALAAGYGKTVSSGTSTVNGSVRGSAVITHNEASTVTAYTPFSSSTETMTNNVVTNSNYNGGFGSSSAYTTSEWSSGALGVAYTTESGSGWSNITGRDVTNGYKVETSVETSGGGLWGHGATTEQSSTTITDTHSVSNYTQVDTYTFEGYDLTIGASKR